jgi:hypothetical protein
MRRSRNKLGFLELKIDGERLSETTVIVPGARYKITGTMIVEGLRGEDGSAAIKLIEQAIARFDKLPSIVPGQVWKENDGFGNFVVDRLTALRVVGRFVDSEDPDWPVSISTKRLVRSFKFVSHRS